MLERALQIIWEQHALSNIRWKKSINKIIGVRKMVDDRYNNRITNPQIWKEYNNNMMFYE